jgi:hypothetical protein
MGKHPGFLIGSFVSFALLTLSCGEPEGPTPAVWVKSDTFPAAVETVNALDFFNGNVYAAVTYRRETGELTGAILRYDYYDFTEEYAMALPDEGALLSLDFAYFGEGWVVGYAVDAGGYKPLLIHYPEWENYPLTITGGQVLKDVFYAGTGACFILHDGNEAFPLTGTLLKYDNGAVIYYDGLGRVSATYARPNGLPDRFYCVAYEPIAASGGKGVKIYSTGDDGASWVEELCPAATFGGRRPASARAAAWFGTTLYFTVAFDDGATGVVSRAGPPGGPVYTLVFVSYAGPYFTDLNSLAFRGNDSEGSGITADGVGVGTNTAIRFAGENVVLEKLPYQLALTALCRAGGNGFWAAGFNYATRNCDLLFHP